MRRKTCQQGAGLLAGQEVPTSLGSGLDPWTEGLPLTAVLFSSGVTVGLDRAGRLELTPQLWAGKDRDPSLAWLTRRLNVIQVMASRYKY